MERPRRAMRSLSINGRSCRLLDTAGGRGMVAVSMGRSKIALTVSPEANRSLESKRARITGDQGPHARRDFGGSSGDQIEGLVVGDIFAHAPNGRSTPLWVHHVRGRPSQRKREFCGAGAEKGWSPRCRVPCKILSTEESARNANSIGIFLVLEPCRQ